MAERCEICGGSEIVRLPIRRPVMEVIEHAKPDDPAYRQFPCPACCVTVDDAKVAILQCQSEVTTYPEMMTGAMPEIMKRHGYMLVDELISSGCVTTREIERTKDEDDWPRAPGAIMLRSRVGVVSSAVVESIEKRALMKALVIAQQVVFEAQAQIGSWGSYYQRNEITKEQANVLIAEAGHRVAAKAIKQVGN